MIENQTEHDRWFREKVREALDDPRPAIPNNKVEAYFAQRRAASLRKIEQEGL